MTSTLVLTAGFFLCCFTLTNARQLPDLYWNSSNPLFLSGPSEGGAHVLTAEIMDSLTIHCPHYNDTTLLEHTEQAAIFRVSKSGFEKCIVDEETSEPVAKCADPYRLVNIPVVFRQYTPVPNGLEYEPGNSYYFISTSDGSKDGLNFRQGGLCLEHNLRLKIVIKQQKEEKMDGGGVFDPDVEYDAGDGDSDIFDDDMAIPPKFRRPKTHLRNSPSPTPANSVDSVLASLTSDKGVAATTPPFWNDFLRKAFLGEVGQERFTTSQPPPTREAFALDNDSEEEDSSRQTPITYSVDSGPDDSSKRRGLREKAHTEQKNGLQADESSRDELLAKASNDPGFKLYEIHELQEDLPTSSLRSSSSSSRMTSFSFVLITFVCLFAVIRWLS